MTSQNQKEEKKKSYFAIKSFAKFDFSSF